MFLRTTGLDMNAAPLPANEVARLAALRAFGILDTPSEQDFDDFTALAAQLCGTSMALITLIDEKRQWFKSRRGFQLAETPRELSLCAHAILGVGVFEVPDATLDPRFVDNPLVQSGQLRFYAGAPLTTTYGHNIGTLSVLDTEPRRLNPAQRETLLALARQAMRQIELRRMAQRLREEARCREFEAALSHLLTTGSELRPLLVTCATKLAEHCDAVTSIWTSADDPGELQREVTVQPSALRSAAFSTEIVDQRGRETIERVADERKPLVTSELSAIAGLGQPNPWQQFGLTAFAGFPLVAHRDLLGVLALWGTRAFTPEETATLSTIATTLAMAIELRGGEARLRNLNAELETRVASRTNALAESERRHRTLLSNLPGTAYRCRNAPDWPTDFVSDGSHALLGVSPEALMNGQVRFADLIHPGDQERVRKEVDAALSQHKPFALEYQVKHASGDWRWVWEHGRGIENESGTIDCIEGFVMDISARKHGERQALRTQRLESLGTLAGGVAHDLNNALAPILMGLELLRIQPKVSEQLIETMMASARRGADMVRQLLMFARGAEGSRQLVQSRHLFAELERIIRGTFPKNIELRVNVGSDVPGVVGDPTQFHQVLLNLCVNARDAMPQGGQLRVTAEKAQIDAAFASSVTDAQPGAYTAWTVTDTGTGIAAEIIDRIFEPFFTTKAPEKGTGLGLSTVMGIVRSHGGFVRVESTLGRGTRFLVYLPAADLAEAEPPATIEAQFHGAGEVVLVVDDDPAVRHVTHSVLTALNYKVVLAADGTEALLRAAAVQEPVRIVITDFNMPHMDGLAFAHVIKRMLPHAGLIVASGRLDARVESEFAALGAAAVLHKPFGQDKLVAALRLAMAENQTAASRKGTSA